MSPGSGHGVTAHGAAAASRRRGETGDVGTERRTSACAFAVNASAFSSPRASGLATPARSRKPSAKGSSSGIPSGAVDAIVARATVSNTTTAAADAGTAPAAWTLIKACRASSTLRRASTAIFSQPARDLFVRPLVVFKSFFDDERICSCVALICSCVARSALRARSMSKKSSSVASSTRSASFSTKLSSTSSASTSRGCAASRF
mmetsp:Transcript_10514/g.34848  ORF Transcript_10514/g.34848 Transcript_10514/m.34848 type:complete len:205 (-) Transcript_10514:382-996(-)